MSITSYFASKKCPDCGNSLAAPLLFFFASHPMAMDFQITCPRCKEIIDVELETYPSLEVNILNVKYRKDKR